MDHRVDIERYLMERMSEAERQAFEQRLAEDAALAKQLKLERAIILGIADHSSRDVERKLDEIRQEYEQMRLQRRRRNLLIWLVVMGLLLLGSMYFFWPESQEDTPDGTLYAQYYERPVISLVRRSSDPDSLRFVIDQYYYNEQFGSLLRTTEALASDQATSEILLAAGIAAMELNQFDRALDYFNRITQKRSVRFGNHALWYSALCYLVMDREEQALPLLHQIALDAENDHYGEANRLAKALGK